MKSFPLIASLAVSALCAGRLTAAAPVTESYGPFTPGTLIADNDAVATSFLASISSSAIVSLTDVSISFELRGSPGGNGFANDMFASLLRSPLGGPVSITDPAAVLLNQVVSFHDGWNITLSDSASTDIHVASPGSGILSGVFQPDGRLVPTDVARPALMGVFAGLPGNGDWRFNVADLAEYGQMELVSWSLTLTGNIADAPVVPEASTWASGIGLLGVLWLARRRARSNQ